MAEHNKMPVWIDKATGRAAVACYMRATADGELVFDEDCVCADAVYPNFDGDETISLPMVRELDHLAVMGRVRGEAEALVKALEQARQVIATALWTDAPDWFDTEEKVSRHHAIKQIDAALAAYRAKGGAQ